MLKVSSSTTASDERGPTPICSTVAWPNPTTRSAVILVIGAKISQRRREDVAPEDRLRADVALQRVDGLRELRARVVRAPKVIEQFGTAGDVRRVVGKGLELVDRVRVDLGLVVEEPGQQREVLAEAGPQILRPPLQHLVAGHEAAGAVVGEHLRILLLHLRDQLRMLVGE